MLVLLIKWASQLTSSLNLMQYKITMRLLLIIYIGLLGVLQTTNANGKPWCKGRNYPGGRECCESEDPEGSKCTEGQGDCDSDAGCAGDLVCGRNNCREYHSGASHRDDCCTRPQGSGEGNTMERYFSNININKYILEIMLKLHCKIQELYFCNNYIAKLDISL